MGVGDAQVIAGRLGSMVQTDGKVSVCGRSGLGSIRIGRHVADSGYGFDAPTAYGICSRRLERLKYVHIALAEISLH